MTKPQIEDGYLKIANELVEALAKSMPGFTEGQIVWAVLRKTYGWHKKEDEISISQLVKMTGKSKRMVIYALKNLEAKKMIVVKRSAKEGEKQTNKISFNKKYDEWVVQKVAPGYDNSLKKKRKDYQNGVVQRKTGSATIGKKVVQRIAKNVQIVAHTKDTYTKDTIQKKRLPIKEDLENIDIKRIALDYQVPENFVVSCWDDVMNYCYGHDKKYSDWSAVLRNFVKRDAIKIKEAYGKPRIVDIPID